MPTARIDIIPTVFNYVKNLDNIKSVLDIGCGFGKMGMLAREYIQIWNKDLDIKDFKNYKKKLRVDALEICAEYINDIHYAIYNNIFIGDIAKWYKEVGEYDIIIMGDIIEHLKKKDGLKVLKHLRKKCKYLIITTPNYEENRYRQIGGHDYEKHLSFWDTNSFPDDPKIYTINKINVVFYEQNNKNN